MSFFPLMVTNCFVSKLVVLYHYRSFYLFSRLFHLKSLCIIYLLSMSWIVSFEITLNHFCLVFVAPALGRCNIGVRFSVRPSVRSSFHSHFTPTLALSPFK